MSRCGHAVFSPGRALVSSARGMLLSWFTRLPTACLVVPLNRAIRSVAHQSFRFWHMPVHSTSNRQSTVYKLSVGQQSLNLVTAGADRSTCACKSGTSNVSGYETAARASGAGRPAEPQLQALWRKLRDLRQDEDRGNKTMAEWQGHGFQVINLGDGLSFPSIETVSCVLKRRCYALARDEIEKHRIHKIGLITGTPGTEIVHCLYDTMYEYADGKHNILWHSWVKADTLYWFGPGGVRKGTAADFGFVFEDPNTVYLCDDVTPARSCEHMLIAVSPPKLVKFPFYKYAQVGTTVWLPVPTEEEMLAVAPLYGVDEQLCKQRYAPKQPKAV